MTKIRAPLTFAQAITRVAGVVGWPAMAALTGRSERAVRYWSEDDQDGCPTIAQALVLDVAYRRAGGEGAPIFETYAAQIDVGMAEEIACPVQLTADIGIVAKEMGDVVHSALIVAVPGASPAEVHRAIFETEQASGRMAGLVRRLASFLKPARVAGSGTLGGTQK